MTVSSVFQGIPWQFQGYLFDLDGVLWLGHVPIPGARETLAELRRRGRRVVFVSNTSSRSRKQCLATLWEMGFAAEPGEVFVASEATARYPATQRPGAVAYVIGSDGLVEEMRRAGLDARRAGTRRPDRADYLVVGKDKALDFTRLTCALRVLRSGAGFVAVNCDATVPAADGLEPGAGAIVGAIAAMVGRQPDVTVGKPGTLLLEMALRYTGLSPGECAMVGDTLAVDVAAGKRLGVAAVLVLSGNTSHADLTAVPSADSDLLPDLVIGSLEELLG